MYCSGHRSRLAISVGCCSPRACPPAAGGASYPSYAGESYSEQPVTIQAPCVVWYSSMNSKKWEFGYFVPGLHQGWGDNLGKQRRDGYRLLRDDS